MLFRYACHSVILFLQISLMDTQVPKVHITVCMSESLEIPIIRHYSPGARGRLAALLLPLPFYVLKRSYD